MTVRVELELLDGDYAVCLLQPDRPIPHWVDGPGFVSISRGGDELSIVCRSDRVPAKTVADRGWRALKLTGSFAFDETGVVLSVIKPLSEAGLGVFVTSTYRRDYVLVKAGHLDEGLALLTLFGHRLAADPGA